MNETVNETIELEDSKQEQEVKEEKQAKTYTEEQVLDLIKSETSKALATQQKKYEKQLSLSKLDGAEREKAEKDNRIAELEEQLKNYTMEKNKSELKSVLSSRGLSAEFADIININDDIELSQANIDKFDKLFKTAVKLEVEKRLAGSIPKGSGSSGTAAMDKESFNKLPLGEQQKLLNSNKEFYSQFLK